MTSTESLDELRRSVTGAVIAPEDPGFDAARRSFNALIDRRPAVIVRCTGAEDVVTALDFARSNGLEVAVRGGGHNPAGHCVVDGGLVIDLSQLRSVEVDPDARVARAAGGSTWLDFDTATQAFGMVAPGGVVGSTGVGGLTLGGGIGHLTSQHGLTCDNLVGAELVTPDGAVIEADGDLLWGLRGGGGNFGVATRLDFRLHELDGVVGGRLAFGGNGVRDAFRRFRDIAADAPHELSIQAGLSVDESLAPTFGVYPSYTGSDGAPQLQELRSLPGVLEDGLRAHTFMDQQRLFDSPYGETRHYWKGHFVRELPDELIDVLLERVVALGRPPGGVLIESLHGAPKDADGDSSAVGWRRAAFNVSAMAQWQDPTLDEEYIQWARDTAAAIEPWSFNGAGYVNYLTGDEPIERIRAAFGDDAFARLQALKSKYDPENVLRRNQNIPPT
jgi:FAD/FMN-containing dehydrogenase